MRLRCVAIASFLILGINTFSTHPTWCTPVFLCQQEGPQRRKKEGGWAQKCISLKLIHPATRLPVWTGMGKRPEYLGRGLPGRSHGVGAAMCLPQLPLPRPPCLLPGPDTWPFLLRKSLPPSDPPLHILQGWAWPVLPELAQPPTPTGTGTSNWTTTPLHPQVFLFPCLYSHHPLTGCFQKAFLNHPGLSFAVCSHHPHLPLKQGLASSLVFPVQ